MKTLRLTLILLSMLAFSLSSNGRTAVGTMDGTVMDGHGKPVPGATVTIQTSDGQHPHATHTDGKGRFTFARFATGQYDLRAYSDGSYSEWAKRIVIRARKPTQITLRIANSKS
jgi:protocatechuate 3,4-dioxygenase beta subunit